MTFIKGKSGNKRGRPKNPKTIAKEEAKEKKAGVFDMVFELFNKLTVSDDELIQLTPSDKINLQVKLLPYLLPKLAPIEPNKNEDVVITVEYADEIPHPSATAPQPS